MTSSRSTNFMHSCLCQSMHCSMMFLRAKIWSVHPLFFLNPGCSFLSSGSTASDIRLMMILPLMILLETDKKVKSLLVASIRQDTFPWYLHNNLLFPVIWNFLSFSHSCGEASLGLIGVIANYSSVSCFFF